MKKFLVLLAVLVIAAMPVLSAEITSVTKELSQAGYPGVLVKGSLTGTSVFVADSAIFENSVILESIDSELWAILSLKTDFGTVGFSATPLDTTGLDLTGIGVSVPGKLFSLTYSGKLSGLPLGVALSYGTDRTKDTNYELDNGAIDPDYSDEASQYMGLRTSSTFGGIDVAIGVALANYIDTNEDYTDADSWDYWEQYDNHKLAIDAAGRMSLGNDFTAFATLKWLTGKAVYNYKDDNPEDSTETYSNGKLTLEALLGKNIKANESLTVMLATGLKAGGTTFAKYRYIDNLDHSNDEYTNFNYDETSYITVPVYLGVEGRLNETWGVNFGITADLISVTGTKDGENTAYYQEKIKVFRETNAFHVDPDFTWALGADAKIGDLKLDMYINTTTSDLFTKGPFFISGDALSDPLGAGIALIYDWK